jgi:hypothetical protein
VCGSRFSRFAQVERSLLQSLLRMFYDLGLYADQFECKFLETTASFYALEAAEQLQLTDVPAYLLHVRARLSQEEDRIQHYLHLSTRKVLMHTCLQTLLAVHIETILDKGFKSLMEQMRLEDLSRMYNLYMMVDGLPKLRQVVLLHVWLVARRHCCECARKPPFAAFADFTDFADSAASSGSNCCNSCCCCFTSASAPIVAAQL